MNSSSAELASHRVLLAEDEYLLAQDVSRALRARGATVVGPAATLSSALELTEQNVDLAVLDINLQGELVYPLADTLKSKGVPFIFVSGYINGSLPSAYANAPYLEKPLDIENALHLLSGIAKSKNAQAPQAPKNAFLEMLSDDERDAFAPHLERIDLPARFSLKQKGRVSDFVHFIDHGVAALIPDANGKAAVQAALIGREGIASLAHMLGAARSTQNVRMQIAGAGRRMPAPAFASAVKASAALRTRVQDVLHKLIAQIANTARVNAVNTVEERLARLLLMLRDRLLNDKIDLTHEAIASMLGVRRAGVTHGLQRLERAELVATTRGAIWIKDRDAIEELSNGAYSGADRSSL